MLGAWCLVLERYCIEEWMAEGRLQSKEGKEKEEGKKKKRKRKKQYKAGVRCCGGYITGGV